MSKSEFCKYSLYCDLLWDHDHVQKYRHPEKYCMQDEKCGRMDAEHFENVAHLCYLRGCHRITNGRKGGWFCHKHQQMFQK